jgi:hypothetical protein
MPFMRGIFRSSKIKVGQVGEVGSWHWVCSKCSAFCPLPGYQDGVGDSQASQQGLVKKVGGAVIIDE